MNRDIQYENSKIILPLAKFIFGKLDSNESLKTLSGTGSSSEAKSLFPLGCIEQQLHIQEWNRIRPSPTNRLDKASTVEIRLRGFQLSKPLTSSKAEWSNLFTSFQFTIVKNMKYFVRHNMQHLACRLDSLPFIKKSTSALVRYQKTVKGQVGLTRILAEKEQSRLPKSNQRGREDGASLIMRSSYEAVEEGLRLEMLCVELRVRPIYSLRTTCPLRDRNYVHPLAALEGDNTKFLVKNKAQTRLGKI